ncbi:MAG: DUF2779 domain-containing protein [Pedosphaera sp.]|nr:DUF2779 domain-containing protein [Pedosphaera sp.]
MNALLSKSTYLMGLQCPKLLWHRFNAREEIPEPEDGQKAIFDQGREVGALAKKLFPNGIEIAEGVLELDQVAQYTQDALPFRRPLFEAACKITDCYARADILVPVGLRQWDILEVKSATKVKAINHHDLAFQKHVFTNAGLKIRKTFLLHINNEYVRQGEIDPPKYFTKVDLSEIIAPLVSAVPAKVAEMLAVIARTTFPPVRIGRHCTDPYHCLLTSTCWNFLPKHNSVLALYRVGAHGFTLINEGITKIADIPETANLTGRQLIQWNSARSGKPHVDSKAVQSFLKLLKYPLTFMDFETFASAIPLINHSKPYEQVPFQFSLHVVAAPGARPVHRSFLARDARDPRPDFMRELAEKLPGDGSIVVYNASFEIDRLKACCDLLPDYSNWFAAVPERIIDLLEPFRAFNYYHPDQSGSVSLKAVLPVLTKKSYVGLEIQEGGVASREFLRVTFGDVSKFERAKIRRQLEDYCGLDTLGMVAILNALSTAP